MNSSHVSSNASRPLLRFKSVTCGITMGLALFVFDAQAQWTVIDPANISQNATNFVKTVAQYAKDVAQYQAVLAHYQQQLIQLTHMNFTLPQMQNTYTEIAADDGMDVACPGPSGVSGVVSGIIQMVSSQLNLNKTIAQSQLEICQQIVFRQNDKYNQTVKMINRLQTFYVPNVQSLTGQLSGVGSSQGAMSGTEGNAQINANALETEMNQWKSQIEADDSVISMLQDKQTILATKAMQGSNTVLGNVVQAAAFEAAFSAQ